MKRIHDNLRTVLGRQRLVFWYDPDRQWQDAFDSFEEPGLHKLTVEGNEFGTKVAIHRDRDRDARYLLYFPSARPPDNENWLLDMLLQGHEYRADRASLAVQELGLRYELQPVVEAHLKFFGTQKREQALGKLVSAEHEDDEHSLRLKMMAVLAGAAPEIDQVVLRLLSKAADDLAAEPAGDPVVALLGPFGLSEPFWQAVQRGFGYASPTPTLRDFAITLFQSANPLASSKVLNPHARVFLQQWKDSRDHGPSFTQWAEYLEGALNIQQQLNDLREVQQLGQADVYPSFERYALSWLCQNFEQSNDARLLDVIETRRQSHWYGQHRDGYEAVAQAISLRQQLKQAELKIGSLDTGLTHYTERWYAIDTAYRRFCYHQRQYGQVQLLARMTEWVEKTYVNNFLLPLADQWGDQVRKLAAWRSAKFTAQTSFFDNWVRPFVSRKQKVYVVISDALRYEAAAEFAKRLQGESRWTAKLEALLGALPSYTQLGMAALLPGDERSIQSDSSVLIDGKSASGTEARKQILGSVGEIKATAIQARDFLALNTKTEARALLRDHDVVYIYHNVIDDKSHSVTTETTTPANVEEAFDELLILLRKINNANGYNILLTSDHGFLFQQGEIDEKDEVKLPSAAEWIHPDRRYATGRGIVSTPALKVFGAAELGLSGDWQAAFPLSLGRFPLQGAGKRYVHGGLSLQEVVVPVLHVNIARTDDISKVEVDLLRVPPRITTGQVTLSLYQAQPIADKVLARPLQIGIFALDGTPLSELRTLPFDSADPEPRQRESTVGLTLSKAADAFNNQEIEIRLVETVAGSNQTAIYKYHKVRLQKPFASDFDD